MTSHRFDDPGPLVNPEAAMWASIDGKRWIAPDYERWRPEFVKAMDGRLYTIEYLDALVLTSRAQVWFSCNAAIVTELKTYPTGTKAIHGLVAAGDLQEIVGTLIPRAEDWARDHAGCAFAMIESREGWARALKGSGYESHQLTLRKAL